MRVYCVALIACLMITSCKPRQVGKANDANAKETVISAFVEAGGLADFLQKLDTFKEHNYLSIEDEVHCDALARICTLKKLEYLSIAQNSCADFPPAFNGLAALKRLDLGIGVGATAIPEAVFAAKGLRQLDLHGFELVELPAALSRLSQLEVLGLTATAVQVIPKTVATMPSLKEVYLSVNDSTEVLMARLKEWNPRLSVVAD